ncbi:MAG: hypothetical protein ABW128_03705 [Rhizorhabdus sp.]
MTRQGVNAIYRRVALAAYDQGLVVMPVGEVEAAVRALSTHSLRDGLTQDLFAAGEDGVGIAQALRWSSPSTALRYGRKLAARSNVAARVRVRGVTAVSAPCRPCEIASAKKLSVKYRVFCRSNNREHQDNATTR